MTGWGKASARKASARFTPERNPMMSYGAFRRVIDTRSIRRDYLRDDFEYHGTPQVALSRNLKIAIQPNDDRAFYYRDKPFLTMDGYQRFLTIDISRFPRPAYVLKAAQKVLDAIPTNISLGPPEDGHCQVRVDLVKQVIRWNFERLSLTFHAYEAKLMGPKTRINFEHDPTRYYTPEEKEVWAWSNSKSCMAGSVIAMEACSEKAAKDAQLQAEVDDLV